MGLLNKIFKKTASIPESPEDPKSPKLGKDELKGDSPTQTSVKTASSTIKSEKSESLGIFGCRVLEAKNLYIPSSILDKIPADQRDKKLKQGNMEFVYYNPYVVIQYDKNEITMYSSSGKMDAPSWKAKVAFDFTREAELILNIYQKTVDEEQDRKLIQAIEEQAAKGRDRKKAVQITENHFEQQDLLLGSVIIPIPTVYEKLVDLWLVVHPPVALPQGRTPGQIHLQLSLTKPNDKAITMDDFELMKVIGKGSFGKVMQVRKKDTGRVYAMKIIKKSHIVQTDEVEHTLAERQVLAKINHPFIVSLKFSFQSPEKLYFCLDFVNGGELFHHLQNEGRFGEIRSKFYAAELVLALECLHKYNIIYRDLKPENILLDGVGHLALCDFGLCKINVDGQEKTTTFCGTPEYLAPEVLQGKGYTKAIDWWTLGILLYEMITGLPPFYDENVQVMYKKIMGDPLVFPAYMSPESVDLLKGIIERDPVQRYNEQQIKSHAFFNDIDFEKLYKKQIIPPFKPRVAAAGDTSNFDEIFTSEMPKDSYEETRLSASIQEQFVGFTFVPGSELQTYAPKTQLKQ